MNLGKLFVIIVVMATCCAYDTHSYAALNYDSFKFLNLARTDPTYFANLIQTERNDKFVYDASGSPTNVM